MDDHAGPDVGDTHAISNNVLTLVNAALNRGYIYYRDDATVQNAPLTPNSSYEIHARARVETDYAGSGVGDVALFAARVIDGTRMVGLGVSYNHSTSLYNFYFTDTGGFPINFDPNRITDRYAQAAPLRTDGFFDIRVRKGVGTAGNVDLFVDNVLALSTPYTDFSTAFAGNFQLMFGNTFGTVTGTSRTTGVNFGINEAAPTVPEPATAGALIVGAGATVLRRRRVGR